MKIKDIEVSNYLFSNNIDLSTFTSSKIEYNNDKLEEQMDELRNELSEFQDKMYAHNKYSVLICLQGMDTSGKDSLIREVFKGFNARGVVVQSFKVPSNTELEHDYLWRHYIALPEKGKITVFNRSHYENVLVTRVHPEYILGENIPAINSVEDINQDFWSQRMESINNFEKHLAKNGTIILKFFLNLSKDEQKKRLLRRLETPKHNWKFSEGDLKERKLWNNYQSAYYDLLKNTHQSHAPWFVIPADDKDLCRYIVAKTIHQELLKYTDVKFPELDEKIKANLSHFKDTLENEE
jgi:PPK2 family polyphosphate:nucleotide phosphotransferase